MILDYRTLKSFSDDFGIIGIFEFLGKLKNASLKPGVMDSDCPQILFWWFEEEDAQVNQLIADAVKNFPWEEEWVIEAGGNEKWVLFPKKLCEAERIIQGSDDKNIEVTTNAAVWLMKNDPDFGRRANKDLDKFRKYFRAVIENFLMKKEKIK